MQNTRKTRKSFIIAFIVIASIASIVAVFRANQKPNANTVAVPVSLGFIHQFEADGSHKILNNWIAKKYKDGYQHLKTAHKNVGDTVIVNTNFLVDGISKNARGTFTRQGKVLELDIE